jgi:hypothetical protein
LSPLVKLPGFDEATRRHTWKGTRLPAVYEGQRGCPRCSIGYLVRMAPHAQPALFYHGGYGATERLTYDLCIACGRVSVVEVETLNPRKL